MKKLGDGLLQLAVIISLFRTEVNLNNYINDIFGMNSNPEMQEILLGPLSGYTQTSNIHNQNWHYGDGMYSHPKSVESYFSSSIFRDLHSLGHYHRFDGIDTRVNAWLVNHPEQQSLPSENANINGNSASHNNGNDDIPTTAQNDATFNGPEGAVAVEESSSLSQNMYSGAELTKEEMDLIDVLWMQDIDLGVAREMYDANLRKEAEKKRELDLQKQNELEQLERLKQEKEEKEQQTNTNINYIVDGETGELVPVGPGVAMNENAEDGLPMPPPYQEPEPQDQNLSIEEAMKILEQQVEDPGLQNVTHCNNASNVQLQQEIDSYLQSQGANQMSFSRQTSFEQRWQDVASLLHDLQNSSNINSMLHSDMTMENSTQSPLVQNATLPAPINNTFFTPDVQNIPFPPFAAGNGTFSSSQMSNSTGPGFVSPGNTSFYNMDTQDLIFPNISGLGITLPNSSGMNTNNTFGADPNENLLQQLLEDEVDDLEFPELPISNEGTNAPESMQVDTASTSGDSAVSSMRSMSSPIQDQNDTRSTVSSSYDGLEGASGGADSEHSMPNFPTKQEKFDPGYSFSDYSHQPTDLCLNQSSSGNDTDYGYSEVDMRQVRHNHTYPLQPGQHPKERKSSTDDKKGKSAYSRDEKRAKSLNVPFSVQTIIHSPVEEFNEMLQKYKLNEQQLQLIRDIRRRGKNKVAAQNCRKRKIEVITSLDDDVAKMRSDKDRLLHERHMIDKELNEMKSKFGHLYREVFRSLRDDSGQPYDPNEYSLQQSADGNVFLVPRNSTSSPKDDHQEKSSRKRKAQRK